MGVNNSCRLTYYLLVLEAAFTRGGLSRHHQAVLARFESTGASALHTLPFGFNPGDATGTHEIGV